MSIFLSEGDLVTSTITLYSDSNIAIFKGTTGTVLKAIDLEQCEYPYLIKWSTGDVLWHTGSNLSLKCKKKDLPNNINVKKTFIEALIDIKEGESYSGGSIILKCNNDGDVYIENPLNLPIHRDKKWFSLVVEKVSFSEAIKAYKKGKSIQSLITNKIHSNTNHSHVNMLIEEIEGEWVILETE